mgnify:CR=1 FL=1
MIRKRQTEIGLAIIILVFIAANVISIVRNNIPDWDESVYIGMGKYMFSGGNAGAWEMLRPLPMAFFIGLSWKAGLNPIYAGKALGVLFSVLNIIFTYKIGKELFNRKAGLFAAFFLAITPVFFKWSGNGMTEMPSVFFTLLALWLLVKNKNMLWIGVCAGISFLFKFPNGLFMIVFAVLLLFYWKKNKISLKPLLMCLAGFGVVILPFIVFNLLMYGGEVNPFAAMFRPMLIAAKEQSNPFYPGGLLFYLTGLIKTNPLLVFSITGLFFFLRKKECGIGKALLAAYAIIGLLYFSIIQNKDLRFAILFLPYLTMLAGYGAAEVIRHKRIGCGLLLIVLIAAIPAAYYDITRSNKFDVPDPSIKEFFSYFNKNTTEGIILTTLPYPMAYSDARFKSIFYVSESPEQILNGVSAAVFAPSAVKCREDDLRCIEQKDALTEEIFKRGKLVASKEYGNDIVNIYLIS